MVSVSRARYVCSTVGFEQLLWNDRYYPPDCPEDWRLAYYMNDFGAVYLPAGDWADARQLSLISAETEDNFELVLEWPKAAINDVGEALLQQLSPLGERISAIVVRAENEELETLDSVLTMLTPSYNVSLLVPEQTDELQAFARERSAGLVWQPQNMGEPVPGGQFQVVSLPCLNLREIKSLLLKLDGCIKPTTRVGLFIEADAQSTQRALEVRTLLELLELA